MIVCAACGRESINGGGGYCPSCYGRRKRQKQIQQIETLEKALAAKSQDASEEQGAECRAVLVDFSRRPAVYEELMRRSDADLRPLGLQVLYEVARAVEGGGS